MTDNHWLFAVMAVVIVWGVGFIPFWLAAIVALGIGGAYIYVEHDGDIVTALLGEDNSDDESGVWDSLSQLDQTLETEMETQLEVEPEVEPEVEQEIDLDIDEEIGGGK